jgi:hypothetical protein
MLLLLLLCSSCMQLCVIALCFLRNGFYLMEAEPGI